MYIFSIKVSIAATFLGFDRLSILSRVLKLAFRFLFRYVVFSYLEIDVVVATHAVLTDSDPIFENNIFDFSCFFFRRVTIAVSFSGYNIF